MFVQYCPEGNPVLRFELENDVFAGDRVLITCLGGARNNRGTCEIQLLATVNYQFLVTRPQHKVRRTRRRQKAEPDTIRIDLNDAEHGLPSCRGDEYYIWLSGDRDEATSNCSIALPTFAHTWPLDQLYYSFMDGNALLAFRYETPPH
ncbi:hypothetical protein HN358_00490 [Candidatus Uhrbacteria bacterium]|nr:hypothetical protein [Candidatus Uhrbacteria bacterium]MBT7717680.1 hypothetical protein [Candidatus Uhrbacteria bacterium]